MTVEEDVHCLWMDASVVSFIRVRVLLNKEWKDVVYEKRRKRKKGRKNTRSKTYLTPRTGTKGSIQRMERTPLEKKMESD